MILAIKGHATRGRDIIQLLEMLGGRNSNNCTGQFINRIYFINKNGYIESTDDAKLRLYYLSYSLNEFKIRYPYVINDVVSRKCHPTIKFQISQMKWDDMEECVIYVLNNQLTARVDDLQPYKEETMEERKSINLNELEQQLDEASSKETTESLNKWLDGEPQPKAPILSNRYDYAEGKCGYVIPDGYEFDSIKQGFQTEIILRPIKPQYPKTYEECCYILDIDFIDNDAKGYKCEQLYNLQKLLICRDAYLKIAGKQMGLGKTWKPDWDGKTYYVIENHRGDASTDLRWNTNAFLIFPTEEIRDTFYENFKDLINECKDFI